MNGGWGVSDGAVAVPSVGQSRELGAVAGCCSDENEFLCGNRVRCPGPAGCIPAIVLRHLSLLSSFTRLLSVFAITIPPLAKREREYNTVIVTLSSSSLSPSLPTDYFLKDVTSLIDEFGSGAPRAQRARGCPGMEVRGVMSRVKAAHT